MKYARNRLLGYGALICALGVLFLLVATNLFTMLYGALGRPDPIAAALLDYLFTLLRFGTIPLGAMLIAAGIAIHLFERGKQLDAATAGIGVQAATESTHANEAKPID